MQINVIEANDPRSFDYLALGQNAYNPAIQQYIENQLTNFSDTLTDAGRAFMETATEQYAKINDGAAIRSAKSVLRQTRNLFHHDTIHEMYTLDELRWAQPVMQRYVMAEPNIRAEYHKQRLDGYSDTYVDMEPEYIGSDHYDYRRVTDGMVMDVVDDDGGDTWVVNTYADDLRGDDVELQLEEKVDIINTWDLAKMFLEADVDPTDMFD